MARKPSAGRTHKAVAEEAGFKRVSLISIVAGTVTGYGAFAVLAAIVGAAFSAADVDTDFSTNDWASTESLGGVATAVTLLLAYLFGGYVAGRMARRSGVLHGVAVFVLSLIGGVAVGGLVAGLGDDQEVEQNLRSIGVPTSWDNWGDVGTATAIAALVLMAVGAILGGMLGERWHTKLARRAADPEYGPEAKARREFEAAQGERDQRIESDDLVRRDRDDMAAQDDEDERTRQQELDEEAELEREREEARAQNAERKQDDEREQELEAVRADEREREDERIRDLDQDDGHRVIDVRDDDRVVVERDDDGGTVDRDTVEEHRVVDVRSDDRELASAAGTTEGAHSSGIDDEPRYTAAEWAALQQSQEVGRSRS
jgi:hypothetical protein